MGKPNNNNYFSSIQQAKAFDFLRSLDSINEEVKKYNQDDEVVKQMIEQVNDFAATSNITYNELVLSTDEGNKDATWSGTIFNSINWTMKLNSGFYIETQSTQISGDESKVFMRLVLWFENNYKQIMTEYLQNN